MRLITAIRVQTQCELDSELKDLSVEKKKRLARLIEERVPSGLASIEEWNELLKLFMDAPAETENKVAKKKLLSYLRGEEYKEKSTLTSKSKWWRFGKEEKKKNA